jgi:hypothetical protein
MRMKATSARVARPPEFRQSDMVSITINERRSALEWQAGEMRAGHKNGTVGSL